MKGLGVHTGVKGEAQNRYHRCWVVGVILVDTVIQAVAEADVGGQS